MQRTIKFRSDLPHHLEDRFVHKWGYAVKQRVWKDFVSFHKSYISDKDKTTSMTSLVVVPADSNVTPLFSHGALTQFQKAALERRCDNIVNFFPDPYNSIMPIRTRLHNISQAMTSNERQFVLEYMDENFPLVDTGT